MYPFISLASKVLFCVPGEFIEEHQRVLQSRLVPVSREITDSRVKTREDLEGLYRKIVSYVLLRSGLGSSTDITTVREATGNHKDYFNLICTTS